MSKSSYTLKTDEVGYTEEKLWCDNKENKQNQRQIKMQGQMPTSYPLST